MTSHQKKIIELILLIHGMGFMSNMNKLSSHHYHMILAIGGGWKNRDKIFAYILLYT